MATPASNQTLAAEVARRLEHFTRWLDGYGETSWDHQSYFAGRYGGWAKALYYRNKPLGTFAVAPMIFSEALLPAARRLFHKRIRFPIADAHYAMGFAFLHQATGEPGHLDRAAHFLEELKKSRCPGFQEYCWGYPFDWVTRNGVMKQGTPLITSTPYMYEAFLQIHGIAPRAEWTETLASIVRHACTDIKDFPTSERASSCSYNPHDKGGVVNASAYRAGMLTSASRVFNNEEHWRIAERNLWFVLESQNPDGSWPYARDGVRDFVDHFHTCFVMKALAKIHTLTGHQLTLSALERGVKYYLANLFAEDGLPRPFAVAPRLTVYKRELYDCAESINLCLLLRDRFPELDARLQTVVAGVLKDWIKPDGSFRSRKLMLGWDNVPMHRWAQSQMFRALAFYVREAKGEAASARGKGQGQKARGEVQSAKR
jgi:hypothetical protein